MTIPDFNELDNPVWNSLNQLHSNFSVSTNSVAFYKPEICPFGAISKSEVESSFISEYSRQLKFFFIVGELPTNLPNDIVIDTEVACYQMVCEERINLEITEEIVFLDEGHYEELYQLVWLCLPGYFNIKTPLMGDYFGIFKNGKLVAVTGERMKLDNYTEISAVVTHPEYTGKGYSSQLVAYVTNKVFDEGKIPFLHVSVNNDRAIGVYEKLGYKIRRKMSFWKFKSKEE